MNNQSNEAAFAPAPLEVWEKETLGLLLDRLLKCPSATSKGREFLLSLKKSYDGYGDLTRPQRECLVMNVAQALQVGYVITRKR